MSYLWAMGVLLKEFVSHAEVLTRRLKEASAELARRTSRPVRYLPASGASKEQTAREIARADGITEGLICVLTAVEPCLSYEIVRDRESKLRWTPSIGQESGRLKRESRRVSSAPPDPGGVPEGQYRPYSILFNTLILPLSDVVPVSMWATPEGREAMRRGCPHAHRQCRRKPPVACNIPATGADARRCRTSAKRPGSGVPRRPSHTL